MSKDLIVPIHEVAIEIYNELAFEFYLENNDVKNLNDEDQNELIDLWNKKKESKYLNQYLDK